ncbi:Cu(I)-responsive transcriptional regulator [Ramlibacter sp. H39-3-26]|uniref:Cu(I)-responsive transcriptional regulator n=1 Tax=Curvibacter soli TaxID=3031331 RepID=UPI0023DC606C|nr:Cu(I)-responsive transcriptional regulator [Ramlibacter sp. H39-3-26]MDF1484420.1 Cu(I)-responsive transcriptional regulator [Ramlibacter sp. H39-3-26]
MNESIAADAGPFAIGQAARLSGVTAKMVRHYESLGLLPAVNRTDAGYRQYTGREVHTLRFIRRARDLGFGMREIAELLRLWQNQGRSSASVKEIALAHIADLDRRMAEMAAMKRTLEHLARCCHGDQRPDCPILEELAAPQPIPVNGHAPRPRVRPGPR